MTSTNLFVVALVLQLLDIHWIIMGSQFVMFALVQSFIVYYKYSGIYTDFLITCAIAFTVVFFSSYQRIQVQKLSFLKSKKTQSLLKE
jgi:hypothetical protein